MKGARLQFFLLFTAIAWLETMYHYLDYPTRGRQGNFWEIAMEQNTAAYGVYALLPLIYWVAAKRRWYEYLGCLAAFSILHTSWNWVTRVIAFPLLGQGSYEYGAMPIRYAMEFPMDVIVLSVGGMLRYQYLKQRDLDLARVALLTRQLQPHFLFNSLNTISALMYEDVAKADRVLGRLCEFLRATIDLREAGSIRLSEELRLLDGYVAVIEARLEERFTIVVSCPQELRGTRVPPLLLQPLVENAIEHGRDTATGRVSVDLTIRLRDGRMECLVEDRGPGIEGRGGGYGLEAVGRRLSLLYGARASWALEAREGGGAVAWLKFPAC